MAFDSSKSIFIIETMENYLTKARPEPEMRNQLDIGYEITDQSVILHEIRPQWNNPSIIRKIPYAKTTFVQTKNTWKVF